MNKTTTTATATKASARYEVQRTGRSWGVFLVTRDERGMYGPQEMVTGGFFDRSQAQSACDDYTAGR